MAKRNAVAWHALLTVYTDAARYDAVGEVFRRMPLVDTVLHTTLLYVYAQTGHLREARELFLGMPQRDVVCWNAILALSARYCDLVAARELFRRIPQWNVTSWNSFLWASAEKGHLDLVRDLFESMPEKNLVSWNALLAALARNGHDRDVLEVFDLMEERNRVSWNTLIAMNAHGGRGKEVLRLFREMVLDGVDPDEASFASLILRFNHLGMVIVGVEKLVVLTGDFGVVPGRDHVADGLGKSGQLVEAEELIEMMPINADRLAWESLATAGLMCLEVDYALDLSFTNIVCLKF